jgi:hypothetical protein
VTGYRKKCAERAGSKGTGYREQVTGYRKKCAGESGKQGTVKEI